MSNDENLNNSNASANGVLADSRLSGLNDSGTSGEIDARLAQLRSPGVHGWTYFIRADGAIKIGHASNFKKRIAGLQTSHQKPLEVLAVVPAYAADEYKTHQLFAHLRIRGEWFKDEPELNYFIERLKADAEHLPEQPLSTTRPRREPQPEPTPSLETQAAIRGLIAKRAKLGAETPEGRTYSNLAEQLENLADYVRPDWATHEMQTLPGLIKRQLERLTAA